MVKLGDSNIITDLREINEGESGKYDIFWEHTNKYLEGEAQELVLAVDKRRHDSIQHLAKCNISVRDLRQEVIKLCPENTNIPSIQWIRLQFWAPNPTHKSSLQYKNQLNIKYMIQNRQLYCNYIDLHYVSALFRYLKEMVIKYKNDAYLIFMDDKHRCKVGEPGYPVVAVERDRQVLVTYNKSIQVLDYDFTKCGIIPNVTMICDIPKSIEQSFYHRKVYVGLKDPIFQPSDPFHHMTELCKILIDQIDHKPFLFLYTDGGFDH